MKNKNISRDKSHTYGKNAKGKRIIFNKAITVNALAVVIS